MTNHQEIVDLVIEVDDAADQIKLLTDEPNTDENADKIAQAALVGFSALGQLAARALALRARP